MPSRVIRSEINRSQSLAKVSIHAELTFRALLLAVDDYGRMDARPDILKAELFPIRRVTPRKIESWVVELAQGEDPPVRIYERDGRQYLYLVNWEAYRSNSKRAAKSKFPTPPENPRESPGSPGYPPVLRLASDECRVTSDESIGQLALTECDDTTFAPWWNGPAFDEFWQGQPRKVQKISARRAWAKLCPSTRAEADRLLNHIAEVWAERAEEWKRRKIEHIPHPATFLRAEEFSP